MRQYCQGVHLKNIRVWIKRKKTLESDSVHQQQILPSDTRWRTAAAINSSSSSSSSIGGEARRTNTTPNGGPHLELGRLWLKIWSKTDFSIAQTTGQHFCTCVFIITAFAIRQCSARPSTLITHKHSPKESQRKPKQNETHEQSLTKLYTYFRLNLDLLHFVAVLGS